MDPRIPPLDGRKWRLNRREVIERAASEVFAERGYHGARGLGPVHTASDPPRAVTRKANR